jgi:hypothetical protein
LQIFLDSSQLVESGTSPMVFGAASTSAINALFDPLATCSKLKLTYSRQPRHGAEGEVNTERNMLWMGPRDLTLPAIWLRA